MQELLADDIKRKINKDEKINKITAVINLAGLPCAGKTTLVDRLLRRSIDKKNNTSTGICEPTIAVNVAVTDLNWIEIGHDKSLCGQLNDESSKHSTEQPTNLYSVLESTSNPSTAIASQHEQIVSTHQINTEVTTTQSPSDHSNDNKKKIILDDSIMKIVKHYKIKDFHDFATKGSLYIRDVGGQIEFKHGLSLLAFGPSIFLFVFNACIGIDQAQEIIYRPKEQKPIPVGSKISTKTALLQCLSSVKALMYTKKYGKSESQYTEKYEKNKSRQPVVLIVGTHMDTISRIEEIKKQLDSPLTIEELKTIQKQLDEIEINTKEIKDIKVALKSSVESLSVNVNDIQLIKDKLDHAIPSTRTINNNLRKIIEEHKFDDIVNYVDDSTPMFEVNNTSDSDEGIRKLRKFIRVLVSQDGYGFNLPYPVVYVLFALEFLKQEKSVLKKEDCEKIAQNFQIEITEIPALLNFFHSNVGILLWFNIESLKQWVVKEPQVIFQQMTKVIEETYIPRIIMSSKARQKIQNRGIFEEGVLQNILRNEHCDLNWNELLDFLIHLRMIAPINYIKDDIKEYFIPCVLRNESESDLPHRKEDINISPIMFTFACGSVPDGLFYVLIVCLMEVKEVESLKISFELHGEKNYKDKIKFRATVDNNTVIISLKSYPSHLEVHLRLTKLEEPDRVAQYCHLIRTTICDGIEMAITCLHYKLDMVKPQPSFICQHCKILHPVKNFRLLCTEMEIDEVLQKKESYWFILGKSSTDVNELLFHEVGSKWFFFALLY